MPKLNKVLNLGDIEYSKSESIFNILKSMQDCVKSGLSKLAIKYDNTAITIDDFEQIQVVLAKIIPGIKAEDIKYDDYIFSFGDSGNQLDWTKINLECFNCLLQQEYFLFDDTEQPLIDLLKEVIANSNDIDTITKLISLWPKKAFNLFDNINQCITFLEFVQSSNDNNIILKLEKTIRPYFASGNIYAWALEQDNYEILQKLVNKLYGYNVLLSTEPREYLLTALIKAGHTELAITLINNLSNESVNFIDNDGNTALMFAAQKGYATIVDKIANRLNAKQINESNYKNGYTALMYAAENGLGQIVSIIIKKLNESQIYKTTAERYDDYDYDDYDNFRIRINSKTALIMAAANGHTVVTSLIISRLKALTSGILGGFLASRMNDDFYYTAAHREAIKHQHLEVVKVFLEKLTSRQLEGKENETKSDGASIFEQSIFKQQLILTKEGQATSEEILELLLNRFSSAHINKSYHDGLTALMVTARDNKFIVMKKILAKLNPEQLNKSTGFFNNNDTALTIAAKAGNTEVVSLLLARLSVKQIKYTNGEGGSALTIAINNNHLAIIEQILEKLNLNSSSPLDKNCNTALIHATKLGHIKTAKVFINKIDSIQLNKSDRNGDTALIWAIRNNHEDIVDLIISKLDCKQINHANKDGFTALHYASKDGRNYITKQLITSLKDQDLNLANKNGDTVLILAAQHGHKEVVAQLLDKLSPEQISHRNKKGRIALTVATTNMNTGVVEIISEKISSKQKQVAYIERRQEPVLFMARQKGTGEQKTAEHESSHSDTETTWHEMSLKNKSN